MSPLEPFSLSILSRFHFALPWRTNTRPWNLRFAVATFCPLNTTFDLCVDVEIKSQMWVLMPTLRSQQIATAILKHAKIVALRQRKELRGKETREVEKEEMRKSPVRHPHQSAVRARAWPGCVRTKTGNQQKTGSVCRPFTSTQLEVRCMWAAAWACASCSVIAGLLHLSP